MRALIVTSMWPSASAPARGSFVRAARDLRRRYRKDRFDVVHAHFGLTAWPALAVRHATRVVTLHGTDVRHPRSRRITSAALGRYDLVAAVSAELARDVPKADQRRVAVLPCGVDLDRFAAMPRREARERLKLDPDGRYLLFPADPARPAKRPERARELADAGGAQ